MVEQSSTTDYLMNAEIEELAAKLMPEVSPESMF